MKAAPPPLPAPVLLVDADLVDDEVERARASLPTSVDVELDCFTRTEPPPESRPRRRRTLFALVTGGVLLIAATGVLFMGRLALLRADHALEVAANGAASVPAPAMLTRAVLATEAPGLAKPSAPAPSSAATPGARAKVSVHAQRGKTAGASGKKASKPALARKVPRSAM